MKTPVTHLTRQARHEFEMDAIAACFIGGTAVTGGIGLRARPVATGMDLSSIPPPKGTLLHAASLFRLSRWMDPGVRSSRNQP